MCGMTVLEAMRPAGPNAWERGRFYDPREAKDIALPSSS